MQNELNSKGYYLTMVQADSWIFEDGNVSSKGTFKEVVRYLVSCGFEMKEVEYAVGQMMDQDHDTAHFGMFKGLIFTTNKKERRVS